MAVPADLAALLDKAWEEKSFSEVLAAPVSALAGVTENDAALLEKAFGIKTVANLGTNKYFRAAHALTSLAELGAEIAQSPRRRSGTRAVRPDPRTAGATLSVVVAPGHQHLRGKVAVGVGAAGA